MNQTDNDPEYLIRLIDYMRKNAPKAILDAERSVLMDDIKIITAKRDAVIASMIESYEPELSCRRERLEAIEGKIRGEQIALFPNASEAFIVKEPVSVVPEQYSDVRTLGWENSVIPYHAPETVIPCSTDTDSVIPCHAPRLAMKVQRDGKTYYRFKSAGYKAIAERIGIVPYVECEGDKAFYLTADEYARVFREHKDMEKVRKYRQNPEE